MQLFSLRSFHLFSYKRKNTPQTQHISNNGNSEYHPPLLRVVLRLLLQYYGTTDCKKWENERLQERNNWPYTKFRE